MSRYLEWLSNASRDEPLFTIDSGKALSRPWSAASTSHANAVVSSELHNLFLPLILHSIWTFSMPECHKILLKGHEYLLYIICDNYIWLEHCFMSDYVGHACLHKSKGYASHLTPLKVHGSHSIFPFHQVTIIVPCQIFICVHSACHWSPASRCEGHACLHEIKGNVSRLTQHIVSYLT